jgi:Flp pilus assembly protein TadG
MSFYRKNRSKGIREKGTILLENAIALPLFFSMLFVFQDAVVISFNWLALQNAVHEGVRAGVLSDPNLVPDTTTRKQNAIDRVEQVMRNYGVYTNENFKIKNSTLYNEVDDESGNPLTINSFACAQEGVGGWDCCNDSKRSLFGDTIYIQAQKTIRVTPISGMLLSLAGQEGTITLSASSRGFIEPSFINYDYSTDAATCAGTPGYGTCANPNNQNYGQAWNGCLDGPSQYNTCANTATGNANVCFGYNGVILSP